MNNKTTKGYILGAIAATTYGMIPLFTLPLYKEGMDAFSLLFWRYLFATIIMGVMTKMRGRDFRLRGKEAKSLLLMGTLCSVSSITLFQSYFYMAAGIASTILFIYPIIVAVVMTLFFKERFRLRTFLCIVVALCGIGLLYKGEDGATLNSTGMMYVLASALSYALYIVGVAQPPLKSVPTVKLTFYILVCGMIIFFGCTRFGMDLVVPEKWYHWANIFALALLPTAVSFLCTTLAAQYIGSTPTAILGALEPVTAIFFGVIFFGEILTTRIILGVIMIIIAVTFVIAGGRMSTLMMRFRKLFPKLKIRR